MQKLKRRPKSATHPCSRSATRSARRTSSLVLARLWCAGQKKSLEEVILFGKLPYFARGPSSWRLRVPAPYARGSTAGARSFALDRSRGSARRLCTCAASPSSTYSSRSRHRSTRPDRHHRKRDKVGLRPAPHIALIRARRANRDPL